MVRVRMCAGACARAYEIQCVVEVCAYGIDVVDILCVVLTCRGILCENL